MSIIDKFKSFKSRRVLRTLSVKSVTNLTVNMRRVTLHGDALSSFPESAEGAYIKLMFDQPGNSKSIMRTYTVAGQRFGQREIDIDFMLHNGNDNQDHGIAALWSVNAKPGDEISVAGPGPAKFIYMDAKYFLLAADMAGLPALIVNLKRLSEDAQGQVFIEILSEADKQPLEKPEKIELVWVVNNDPGSDESPLFHTLSQTTLQADGLAVWVACEFTAMKKIRRFLKTERSVEKSHLYISSYWKRGSNEEQHKMAKREDTDG